MNFLGREAERKRLHKAIDGQSFSTVLVYGRRRVGKSELIKQCLRESKTQSIYYECKQTPELSNVASLAELISEAFGFPPLSFSTLEACLEYIFKTATEKNLVLVLDEYPYLRTSVTGLDSIIQSLIDKYQDRSKLKLILCGSFVDVMKSLLMKENPLYGRIDLAIDLKPIV